jgi:hypothetical protein
MWVLGLILGEQEDEQPVLLTSELSSKLPHPVSFSTLHFYFFETESYCVVLGETHYVDQASLGLIKTHQLLTRKCQG